MISSLSGQEPVAGPSRPRSAGEKREDDAWAQQAERLRALVYARPRSTATFDRWFQLYVQAGERERLELEVAEYRQQHPNDSSAAQVAGLLYDQIRNWEAASEAWQAASQLAPDDYFPLARLARVQVRQAQWDQAEQSLRAALQRKVPATEYHALGLELVTLYQRQQKTDEASAVLAELASRAANQTNLLREVAVRYQQINKPAEARALWLQLADRATRDAELRFEAQWQAMQLSSQMGEQERVTVIGRSLLQQVDPQGSKAVQLRQWLDRELERRGGTAALVAFWKSLADERPTDLHTRIHWADALARAGDIEQARALYRELSVRAPKDLSLRRRFVDLLVRQADYQAAVEELEQLVQLSKPDARLLLELGELQLRLNGQPPEQNYSAAVETWRQAMKTKQSDAPVALEAADKSHAAALGMSLTNWDARPQESYPAEDLQRRKILWMAAEEFYRLAHQRDANEATRNALGRFLHRTGRREEAQAVWLESVPQDRTAADWLSAAEQLSMHGYPDAASRATERAVEAQSTMLAAWEKWLDLELSASRFAKAREVAARMAAVRPQDPMWKLTVLDWRVRIAIASRDTDATLAKLQSFIESRPNDRDAAWERLLLLQATGQLTAQDPILQQWSARPPASAPERLRLAELLREAGNQEAAAKLYRDSLETRGPQRKQTYQKLIELELQQNELPAAREAAEEMVRELPRDAEAHLLLAAVAMRQTDADGTLEILQHAARMAPRDVTIRRQLASSLQQRGMMAEAVEQVLAALELPQPFSEKRSLLAWAAEWARASSDAALIRQRLELLEATKSGEQRVLFSDCLAYWLQQTGDLDLALQQLKAQYRERPLDVELLDRLVQLSDQAGQLDEAIRFQRQLAIVKPSPAVQERLARLYRQNGQTAESIEIWDRLIDQPSTEREALELIDALLQRSDLFSAQRMTEASLSHFPQSWQLQYRAALLHLALNQSTAAQRELTRLLQVTTSLDDRAVASSTDRAAELGTLTWAVLADVRLREARWKQLQSGQQRLQETPRLFSSELLHPTRQEEPDAAMMVASLAVVEWFPTEMPLATLLTWALEPTASPALQEGVAVTAWLQGHADVAHPLLRRLEERQPRRMLPHLIRVLQFGPSSAQTAEWQQASRESFQWLAENAPEIADACRPMFASRLARTKSDERQARWLQQRIQHAPSISAVAHWLQAMEQTADLAGATWREPTLARVDQLLESGSEAASRASSLNDWTMLLPLLLTESSARDSDWPERCVRWTAAMLQSDVMTIERSEQRERGRGPFLPAGPGAASVPSVPLLKRQLQSLARLEDHFREDRAGQAMPSEGVNLFLNREVATDLLQLLGASVSDVPSRVIRYTPSPRPESLSPATFPKPDSLGSAFHLSLLQRVAAAAPTKDRAVQDLLVTHWEKLIINKTGLDDRRSLVPIYWLWWWNRRDEALQRLQALHEQAPQVQAYRLEWARAELQMGSIPAAFAILNRRARGTEVSSEETQLQQFVWRTWSGQLHQRDLIGHEGAVTALAVHPRGDQLASVGVDGKIRLWDIPSGTLLHTLVGHEDMVMSVAYSSDGKTLLSGGYDRQLRRWDSATGESGETLGEHEGVIRAIGVSQDGQRWASADDRGQIRWWDASSGALLSQQATTSVQALTFLSDGRLISLSESGQLELWNDRFEFQTRWASGVSRARSLAKTAEGHQLWVGGESPTIAAWERWQDDPTRWRSAPSMESEGSVRGLAYTPASDTLAIGSDDHLVHVWDVAKKEKRLVLSGHGGRVLAVVLAPDGSWLASAGLDGTIKIWHLPATTESINSFTE